MTKLAFKQRFRSAAGCCRIVIAALVSFYILLLVPFIAAQTRTSGSQLSILTNTQTGTSYSITFGDCGKLLSFSNASAITVSLPQAGPSGLGIGCWLDIQNVGPGILTLSSSQSTIDGSAALSLTSNQGLRLVSTGAAYLTERGSQTANGNGIGACALGGANDDQLTCRTISSDDPSQPGQIALYDMQVTPNAFAWTVPSLIPLSYTAQVPAGQPNGQVMQFGVPSGPSSVSTGVWVTLGPLATQTSVLPSQLPPPTSTTLGGIQSKDCSSVGAVQKLNTDGSVTCAAISSGGTGGGTSSSVPVPGPYNSRPSASVGAQYFTTDWILSYVGVTGPAWQAYLGSAPVTPPGLLSGYTQITAGCNNGYPAQAGDGVTFYNPQGNAGVCGIQSASAVWSTSNWIESAWNQGNLGYNGGGCGPSIYQDSNHWIIVKNYYNANSNVPTLEVIANNGDSTSQLDFGGLSAIPGGPIPTRIRLRATSATAFVLEQSTNGGNTWETATGMTGNTMDYSFMSSPHPAFACHGWSANATLFHYAVH
jgi:hypothetical protein